MQQQNAYLRRLSLKRGVCFGLYFSFLIISFYTLNTQTGCISIDTSHNQLDIIKTKEISLSMEKPSLHELFKLWFLDNHPHEVCERMSFEVDYNSTFDNK